MIQDPRSAREPMIPIIILVAVALIGAAIGWAVDHRPSSQHYVRVIVKANSLPIASAGELAADLANFASKELPDLNVRASNSTVRIKGEPDDRDAITSVIEKFESIVKERISETRDKVTSDLHAMPENSAVYRLHLALQNYEWREKSGLSSPILSVSENEWDSPHVAGLSIGFLLGLAIGVISWIALVLVRNRHPREAGQEQQPVKSERLRA